MTTTYSANLGLTQPGVGDAATTNAWGGLLNTDMALIDSAIAGQLVLSVAGSSNVVLTTTSGAADQERNQDFKFTGVLTGNIYVLFPQSKSKTFSVLNSTTGNFSLSIGVNNGSGSPAGATLSLGQGFRQEFVSDGTDVSARSPSVSSNNVQQAAAIFTDQYNNAAATTATWYTAIPVATLSAASAPSLWQVQVTSQNTLSAIYLLDVPTTVSPVITAIQLQAGTYASGQIDGSGNFQVRQSAGTTQAISVRWLKMSSAS